MAYLNPQKLRHTYATLARGGGANLDDIQNALTHSDKDTTSIYINTENIVDLSTHRSFEQRLEDERNCFTLFCKSEIVSSELSDKKRADFSTP
ncbi:hypothetical protein [Enterococcus sp. AZ109]|uniref:hypothetical protein n=1 Tax=Enterococcus sp. AZ109 TaxID=2774634 RepID=UPI003F6848BE